MSEDKKSRGERAQEAFDVAERVVKRLKIKLEILHDQAAEVQVELDRAIARADYYASANPDLPARSDTSGDGVDTTVNGLTS